MEGRLILALYRIAFNEVRQTRAFSLAFVTACIRQHFCFLFLPSTTRQQVEETRGYQCGGFLVDFRPWWCGCCLKFRNCLVSCGAHTSCYCVMVPCHLWNLLPGKGDGSAGSSTFSPSEPVKRRSIDGKAYEMVRVAD